VIGPFFAPAGTVVVIVVSVGGAKAAKTPPPKVTDVAPARPVPLIVTEVPTRPLDGLIELIAGPAGACVTVKLDGLVLAAPSAVVTAMGPVVAPLGTTAVRLETELNVTDVAGVALNVTELPDVKFVPVIETDVPTGPLDGEKPLIVGADGGGGVTVPLQPGSWNEPIRVSQLSAAFVVGCAS